jgi:hypothetical protein
VVVLLFSSADHRYLCHVHRVIFGIAAGGVSFVVPMCIMELPPVGIFFINFLGKYFD